MHGRAPGETPRSCRQAQAAYFLGTNRAPLSDLPRERLDRLSLEQLIRFVARVDGDVVICVGWPAHPIVVTEWQQRERERGPQGQLWAMLPFGRDA